MSSLIYFILNSGPFFSQGSKLCLNRKGNKELSPRKIEVNTVICWTIVQTYIHIRFEKNCAHLAPTTYYRKTMPQFETDRPAQSLLLLPNSLARPNDKSTSHKIFTLPHPSNIASKQPIRLLCIQATEPQIPIEIYRIQHYKLQNSYLAESNKNATDKAVREATARTAILERSQTDTLATPSNLKRQDTQVTVYNDLPLETCLPYDIIFSLIGAIERRSIAESESEYASCVSVPNSKAEGHSNDDDNDSNNTNRMNYLTLRDFCDMLVDLHHPNWRFVPEACIQRALEEIADSVEESGELYYRVSPDKVTGVLFEKVKRIVEFFPESLPISSDLPDNIKFSKKVIMSCNLLVSLIPKIVFQRLVNDTMHKFEGHDVSISECFKKFDEYRRETSAAAVEQKLLAQSAINIGIQQTQGRIGKSLATKKVAKRTVVAKQKVAVGKGAIDGFFSKKK